MSTTAPTMTPKESASRLATDGTPVWLQVGYGFDGRDALRDVHLVYDAHAIRHFDTRPPQPDRIRPGQSVPDHFLPDRLVLPGLIESHAHLFLEGGEEDPDRRAASLDLPPAQLLARAAERLPRLRRLGVVAVRDAGDKDGIGLSLQRRYRSQARGEMPYVDSPGAAIHHEKRYGRFMGTPIEEHGSIEASVAARIAESAHRIKFIVTGIINFKSGTVTTRPQLRTEELKRAVAAARAAGRQTFAHCSGNDGVDVCIAAGVDSIEHGFFVDDDQLARMRDADIAWVPTFAPVQFQLDAADRLGWSQEVCEHLRRILDGHASSLRRAHDLGVRIVGGSDAGSHGVPHGHGLLRELELMQEAGLSATEVLRSATGAPSERLGFSESFGRLRAGAKPRFLLSDPEVLDNVSALRAQLTVVFDGEIETDGDDPARKGM